MRIPIRPRSSGVSFNITPLIDIVFLLVIFFLVASHFARSEPTQEVELPRASQTVEDDDARRLVITVQANGDLFVAGEQVSIDAIKQMIEDGAAVNPDTYAVRIRGDQATPYRFIEPIMLTCPKYGITKFGFNVLQSEE